MNDQEREKASAVERRRTLPLILDARAFLLSEGAFHDPEVMLLLQEASNEIRLLREEARKVLATPLPPLANQGLGHFYTTFHGKPWKEIFAFSGDLDV